MLYNNVRPIRLLAWVRTKNNNNKGNIHKKNPVNSFALIHLILHLILFFLFFPRNPSRLQYVSGSEFPTGRNDVRPSDARRQDFQRYTAVQLLEHAVLSRRSGLRPFRIGFAAQRQPRTLRPSQRTTDAHPLRHAAHCQWLQEPNDPIIYRKFFLLLFILC